MSMRSLRHSPNKGLTLVEVVAGITILATLLVTILLSFQKHATQIQSALWRQEGIDAANQLLSEWSVGGWAIPFAGDTGTIESRPDLYWRMVDSDSEVPEELNARVLRLEILKVSPSGAERLVTSVEVLAQGGRSGNSYTYSQFK